MIKKIVLVLIVTFSIYPQSIKTKLEQFLTDKYFESCVVSIDVADLT